MGLHSLPRTRVLFLAIAALGLVACGRSGLDDAYGTNAPSPNGSGDDASTGGGGVIDSDGGTTVPSPPTEPPPSGDDAGVIVPGQCDLAPPLLSGCPPVAPRPGGACAPPKDPTGACVYVLSGSSGTIVASFTCGPLGEDLIGWKERDVPCSRACLGDAGPVTPLDDSACTARETVPCFPPAGEGVQDLLTNQIFDTGCVHRDGAGGYTVRFDPQGCAIAIAGGFFSACDVAAITAKRFICGETNPCATAVTLVK